MIEANSRNIFQIYLADSDDLPIPSQLVEYVKHVHDNRGSNQHYLLRGEQLRSIIEQNFDKSVVQSYDKLAPYAYRADLGRYCLVYLYGGWYFDIVCKPLMNIPLPSEADFVLFKDAPSSNPWCIQNAVFYAKQGAEFLIKNIEQIVHNCRHEIYGNSCLDVTGPAVMGENVRKFATNKGLIGWYLPLTPTYHYKNFGFVLPDGSLLAFGKYTAGTVTEGGLKPFGAVGTNTYFHMWHERKVFNSTKVGDN